MFVYMGVVGVGGWDYMGWGVGAFGATNFFM